MTMTRRRLLDDTFKKSVVGNPAIATDSLARMYPGIEMQGWTTQDGTPTPEAPVPIVSAGTQNQETGKWEYKITITNAQTDPDKNQTVTLTADRPLTKWDRLTKKNGVWGWEYKSAEIALDGSEKWYLTGVTSDEYQGFALRSSDYNAMKSNLRLVCDRFAYSKSDKINTCKQENSEFGLRFVVSIEYVPNKTVADWENWLQSNPITVLYQLAEPTFVPLSETEQEQMNVLYTFRPTTVLSNDCECNMSLTYKTKKSMVGGGNPYGLEIGGIAGGGGGYEFEATNRIRTDYIPFYSPDGSRTYTIVGNPYNIANSNAYDNQKNALGSYEMTAGAFTPPAGTWFIRISFSKPDNSDFTQEELNQLIRTFDIERS